MTVVENKIPNVSSLVKKTDFNTKVTEIQSKISNVSSLVKKTDFDTKLEKKSNRVTKHKSKHLLVKNESKTLKTFDLSYFRRENYFDDNNINYLLFEVSPKYLNSYDDSFYKPVLSWNSRGMSIDPRSSEVFSVFLIISISMAIYVYFFLYLKDRSTNSHHSGCLNINGY